MANDVTNVTAAKPKVGGAVFRAPVGTTLPTDATTTLQSAFKNVGYINEDGVTNANTMTSESIKSWDGDVVFTSETEKTDTFAFKMIEAKNSETLKAVYGDSNVTVDDDGDIAVTANSMPQVACSWVIEMVLEGGTLKRMVIPNAKVTAVEDIVYRTNELVGYGVTLTAVPDTSGNTHYEYIH